MAGGPGDRDTTYATTGRVWRACYTGRRGGIPREWIEVKETLAGAGVA